MTTHQIEQLYVEGIINDDTLTDILHQWAVVPLLYDDGHEIAVKDYFNHLEHSLGVEAYAAAQSLYELSVQASRRFAEPDVYEVLQDCISLQEDLWMTNVLTLGDWIHWMEQAAQGQLSLPVVDFHSLFEDLPEGYMIQDFHDDLLFMLEQEDHPKYQEALKQQQLLYRQLGVSAS